jgi:hypothetical protein
MLIQYYRRRVEEEVIQELPGMGIVTRNRYGALVLNSGNVMFVDWDVNPQANPQAMPQPKGFFARFRRAVRQYSEQELRQASQVIKHDLQTRIDGLANDIKLGLRLYETHSGLRGIVTSTLLDPGGETSQELLEYLGADKLYARLCRIQGTYRARLTPKFWRVGIGDRPFLEGHRSGFTPSLRPGWAQRYEHASASFAVCRLITTIGNEAQDDTIIRTVEWHDRTTRAKDAAPLA